MYINQIFELTMVLDNEKFHKILDKVFSRVSYMEETEDGYLDQSLAPKGIIVKYRDSQYKKNIKLIINSCVSMDCDKSDYEKFIRKLDKRIREYFGYKYRINDFVLSGMTLITDIDVGNRKNVSSYIQVLQRIGKVKGFSPANYECIDEKSGFCLDGISNGISFLLYDLERAIMDRRENTDISQKKLKSMIESSKGVLRAEVCLTKPKAIRAYTDAMDASEQLAALAENCKDIFLDTFIRVVPYGDLYKKNKAEEIIRSEVEDSRLRRRMLRMLTLIPEKKSLYLAQKTMNCRNIDKVMDGFTRINLSPLTISKRQDMKYLKNIYVYFLEE